MFVTSQLGLLRSVTYLSLLNNTLLGPLPDALAGMTSLSSLNLGANLLYGTFPDAWGALTNLQLLALTGNRGIFGTIPPAWSSLLRFPPGGVQLQGTNVCGWPPPAWFSNFVIPPIRQSCPFLYMTMIKDAWYPDNPAALTSWGVSADPCYGWTGVVCLPDGQVTSLSLSRLGLRGVIPPAMGYVGNSLTTLDLSYNSLFGQLPLELSSLQSLSFLALQGNPCLFGPLVAIMYLGTSYHYPGDGTALGELVAPVGCALLSGNYSPPPSHNNGSDALLPYSNATSPAASTNDLAAMLAIRASW